jgi:hypothetical protein
MEEIEILLESEGFVLLCWSPLEIEHTETNSLASGYCAELIIETLSEEETDE